MRDFDRSFRRHNRIFNVVFGLALFLIIATFVVQFVVLPYFAVKAVKSLPEGCVPAVVVTEKDGQTQYTVGCKE
jgi:hypothetical protein